MKFHDDDLSYIKSAKTKIQTKLKEFAFYLNYVNGLAGNNNSINSVDILNSMCLAGGVWASVLQDTNINDYDFFTTNEIFNPLYNAFVGRRGIQFTKKNPDMDTKYAEFVVYDLELEAQFYNEALKKIRGGTTSLENWSENKKLQFIITDIGKINKPPVDFIQDTFPFIHTQIYMRNNLLSISPDQYFCCLNKLLVPSPKSQIIPMLENTTKYTERGYKFIEAKELYSKMDSMDKNKSILENTLKFEGEAILDELYQDLESI